jgi:parvulin-like peptidyl-prolyl isomerase
LGSVEDSAERLAPMVNPHENIKDARKKKFQKEALEMLILRELRFSEAQKRGISIDPKSITEQIELARKDLPPGITIEDILKEQGHDMAWLENFVKRPIMVTKLAIQKSDEIKKEVEGIVTEEYVKKFYDENTNMFMEPEKRRIREILVKVPPGSNKEDWDKGKQQALWIVERGKAGDDFASLAKEFSADAYAEKGGDMGFVSIGGLMSELEEVAGKMKIGDVSEPIYTIYGYHVVKLEGIEATIKRPFEKVKDSLIAGLKKRETDRLEKSWNDNLRKNAKIVYLIDIESDF